MIKGEIEKRALLAALRIRNDPELKYFVEFLRYRSSTATEHMVNMSEVVKLHQAQGRCQELNEILKFIEDSATVLGYKGK